LSEKKISNSDLFEIEFLSTAKGVSNLISQISDPDVLSSLRIYDLEKVFKLKSSL